MHGGIMHEKFKSKDDVQYIVGTNIRKICKDKKINLMELSEEIDILVSHVDKVRKSGEDI